MTDNKGNAGRIKISRAILVEGKDDVDAVSKAVDALIIPTHGFGIRQTTWEVMEKAYREIGVIILTDPDHAGEAIRRRLTERFPDAVQCYMSREESLRDDDIGIENASPEDIKAALERALKLHESAAVDPSAAANGHEEDTAADSGYREVTMKDLNGLGLAGTEGAAKLRNSVSAELGTGFCNSKIFLARLKAFRIGYEELETAVSRFRK